MVSQSDEKPGMSFRIASYFVGAFFAMVSYAVGVWAFAVETAVLAQQPVPSLWSQIKEVWPSHPFSFIAWVISIAGLSVVIGYLFDKEVFYRKRAEQKANVDGLTGLYNHRYFQDRLSTEIERAVRYDRNLSLVIFDLDDFKSFNDIYGHQEGDRLLCWLAEVCKAGVRGIDVLARYGGEEFVIILPETGAVEAADVANRIRQAVERESPTVFPNANVATFSAGVASYPNHALTRHNLVLGADTALCYAKHNGKNRVEIYAEEFKRLYRATPEKLKALLAGDQQMGAIEALSAAVDAKDHYTRGHSESVTKYCVMVGHKLGMSGTDIESLKAAALLHDIGKIGTPDSILRKPGPLQLDEWQVIENHPKIGSEILQKVQELSSIVPAVRHHHERFDGLGYPSGLAGKSIPLVARIIALADSYDAMVSDRTYRTALSREDALDEIKRCAGTQFDPELVEMFVDLVMSDNPADAEQNQRQAA